MHHLKSAGLAAATLCLCLSPSIPAVFSPAIAQTAIMQSQKAEGDRLFEQGTKQLEESQHQEALKTFQQALAIYREIGERQQEGHTLRSIGNAYLKLEDYAKALDYQQQALTIALAIKDSDLEARALNNIGLVYGELKQPEKKIEYLQQSLTIALKTQNSFMELLALKNLAAAYVGDNLTEKAIETNQQLLAKAQELQKPDYELSALQNLNESYIKLKEYQESIKYAQQAVLLARRLKNRDAERESFTSLIAALLELKEYQNVIVAAQEFSASSRKLKLPEDEVLALSLLAITYASSGNPQMARTSLQRAEVIAQSLKSVKAKVTVLLKLQYTYEMIGNTQKAEELAQKVLTMAKLSQDAALISTVAENLMSYNFRQSGNFVEAIEQYLNLTLARQIDSTVAPSVVKKFDTENGIILGLYVLLSEDLLKIDKYVDRYWITVRQTKDEDLELGVSLIQTFAYWKKADYVKTEAAFGQFLIKVREKQKPQWEIAASLFEPFIFYATQNYQKLAQASEKFLELQPDNRPGSILSAELFASTKPVIRAYLALSYAKLNSYEKAISISQQNITLINQALLQVSQAQARTDLYSSKSFALNILADVYRQTGQQAKAIHTYREALETAFSASDLIVSFNVSDNWKGFSNPALSYVGLARIYQVRNMPVTAIAYYKQGISRLEQVQQDVATELLSSAGGNPSDLALANSSKSWKQFFLKRGELGDLARTKVAGVYRELADLLLSQERILEAQQVLELLKAQEVQDFTRSNKTENKASVPQTPKEEQISTKGNSLIAFGQQVDECEQKTCPQLTQLQNQRQVLLNEFDQEVQTIEKEFRDRNIRNIDDAALAPKDFLGQAEEIVNAQPGTVLIYPLVMENRIWLLWASRGGIVKRQEVKGVGQKQLGETVLKFRQLLQNPNSDLKELKATSKQLYDWLLQPMEAELKANNIRNLVFSLDRSSRYIPMSALFDGEKYLIERYTVSTILSAGYTDMSQRPPFATQNTQVLAFGLSAAKPGFNSLPNVPAELDAIVRQNVKDPRGVYPGEEFLNDRFTAATLRQNLRKYRVLHIATHGKFVPVNPDKSFLLLGDGNQLEIPKIRTLQNLRNIDLVVLSACETALGGAGLDGVEIAGISSYFLRKGAAKAVMASLWLVNDASTSLSMQQFYKNLATGKMTKAEALQKAQLSFLQGKVTAKDAPRRAGDADVNVTTSGTRTPRPANFSHPYYWAPFILIGNSL